MPVRSPAKRHEFYGDVGLLRLEADFLERLVLRVEGLFKGVRFGLELRVQIRELLRYGLGGLLRTADVLGFLLRTADAARRCRRPAKRR